MADDIAGGAAGGRSGERATGTPNTTYDLSSVLYLALEGCASLLVPNEERGQER